MAYSFPTLKVFSFLSLESKSGVRCVLSCVLKVYRNYSTKSFKPKITPTVVIEPKTMKLESVQFKSCISEEIKLIEKLFTNEGHEIRIVGGAVRDLILGIQPHDLDLATTATPQEMKKIFNENEIRLINMNGEKHGTITPRINEKNFEITTLRVDLVTNGRHALVEFTKNWQLDANRRDLTINAMYLGLDGTLYDYFNGLEDLKNNRVVFVGDAASRIQEDYLRILRYFRFYGKVAKGPNNHDEDVLQAIRDNARGLENVSGERILVELNKILTGNFAGELLEKIVTLDVGTYIGFPKNCNVMEMKKVWDRTKMNDCNLKPMAFLASLFDTEEDFINFCARIKPSTFERDLGLFIINNRHNMMHTNSIKPYQQMLFRVKIPPQTQHSFICELLKYRGHVRLLKEFEQWVIPKFPISGNILRSEGLAGKQLGAVLEKLKEIWIESDFQCSEDDLKKYISTILSDLPQKQLEKKHINSER